ncbi:hypothetical protein ColTof4_12800 [Colletotrichum tofieldiae]|uniref:Uncharacterized protein n=1 Tax=Colletotrichum tofieldiae TaxID=708197 RepID=A0A166Z5S7_9PEZI|nr:hypothetical protein CT0861_01556 [Colletotrichum tofieldiae]GKT67023.1 hypothetical protein ColTof3_14362 [Colletotrichum tofieldiae]GKT80377.1 hypothetical protein ColTof4_12800 [Colletotrichum tofieldiae]GKT94726.1 hypothetical protein Ct61P_12576 [Colletotrichum tofieldiae]
MPFLVVITPNILADKKDEFLGRWPSIKEDISKQPGVIGVAGGQVINESGSPVTDFKFLQTISFNSEADDRAFAESSWAKEREAQFKGIHGGEPRIKKFETGPLPNEQPKPFTQFSFLDIADESKHEEAKQAWLDLVAALGQSVHFGGKSVGDGPSTGLGILGWDSEDEAKAAFTKPEAQAALQKYQTFGKSVGVMVKLDI